MGEEKQVGFENPLNAKNRSPVYTPGISERRGAISSFYHADGLGSTRNITGSTQTSTDTMQTDAFGNSLSRTGTNPTPFLFAGQHQYQADSQSSLMLLGNRYYDAEAGRFLSKDPIKDGDNWYAYCRNNPLNGVDPEGLQFNGGVKWNPLDGKVTPEASVDVGKLIDRLKPPRWPKFLPFGGKYYPPSYKGDYPETTVDPIKLPGGGVIYPNPPPKNSPKVPTPPKPGKGDKKKPYPTDGSPNPIEICPGSWVRPVTDKLFEVYLPKTSTK
ncbi:MAG: RHS repeat-associated core domain-containing protein [Flavobacteriales bacterium]|nr:RHS repeat-associated core domain-containing protein [Flavobacteriales bacterium]